MPAQRVYRASQRERPPCVAGVVAREEWEQVDLALAELRVGKE